MTRYRGVVTQCVVTCVALAVSFAGSLCQAQTSSAGSTQNPNGSPQQASSPAPADEKKPKKVWTNEDVGSSHEPPPASSKNSKDSSPKKSLPGQADAQFVANTRKQLAKLQSGLKDTDQQLSDLKDFLAGKPAATSSGYPLNKGYNRVPVDQQITNLEAKKKEMQGKIDDLLDEARKKGVQPGQLR
jgi:hypothetical protein